MLITGKDAIIHRDASPTPVPGLVMPGDLVVYTVWVTNTGQVDGQGVSISDTIPLDTTYVPGSAATNGTSLTIGDPIIATMNRLQPGQVFTLTFTVIVSQTLTGFEIDNLAVVLAQNTDPPDPFLRLLLDSNGNGIPDIIEGAPRYFIFLPVVLRADGY